MERLHIDRKASDNKYFHRDFHLAADNGLRYIGENYGDEGIKEYLEQYALNFYKLIVEDVKKDGLIVLENRFKTIYEKEEWSEYLHTTLTESKLVIKIDKCPAITYMKSVNHVPSPWYKELTYTVYDVLAKMCDFKFTVVSYNEEDGCAELVFEK